MENIFLVSKETGVKDGVRFWRFQVNEDVFRLSFKASITHHENDPAFYVEIPYNSGRTNTWEVYSFRDAAELMLDRTVRNYYRKLPKNYGKKATLEEYSEMLRLKN